MGQNKILIDTNVYFRLAQSIHPLLGNVFGKKNYCLYIINELSSEYECNPRLLSSYPWFNLPEYIENRKFVLKPSNIQKSEIEEVTKFISFESTIIAPDVSRIDIKCLAYGYVLKIPVATDDKEMLLLGKEYDVEMLKTLNLLKLMLECKYINMELIRQIALYLIYLPDIPADLFNDYKLLFNEDAP